MSLESPAPNEPRATLSAMSTAPDVNELAARVSALEARFPTSSWLFGPSFLKRAFAMWGHVIVVQLLIAIVIWAVIFACALLFGGLAATLGSR